MEPIKCNYFHAVSAVIIILLLNYSLLAQELEQYFKNNCASCHTIGGGILTGPDLKNVEQRQSRDWLIKWIGDPEGVLKGGDPYAVKLQKEARGAIMRNIPGMTSKLANTLLDFIAKESKKEKSQFAGTQLSNRPLLPDDIADGRNLFLGKKQLTNGAPACIGCHHVNSLTGIFGGGRLGLNLTRAYARLNGRKALSAWLVNPPSLTMNPVFKEKPLESEEILALVAFLKSETEQDLPLQSSLLVNFILFGLAGAVLLLVVFDFAWNKRFREVRRVLLRESRRKFLANQ